MQDVQRGVGTCELSTDGGSGADPLQSHPEVLTVLEAC